MTGTTVRIAALALASLALAGCSKTEKVVSQSIMPAALNYYVLTQEISRLRAEIKSSPADRLAASLAKYGDIVKRGQLMRQELAAMGNLPKHQDFLARMDSSLLTQVAFIQSESQAVRALADHREAAGEIDRIERQISGNSLARSRHQAELDELNGRLLRAARLLEALRPQLAALSRKNLEEMRLYNQMVLERQILTYTAPENLLALFDWEQLRAPAKAAAKKAPAKKTRKPGK